MGNAKWGAAWQDMDRQIWGPIQRSWIRQWIGSQRDRGATHMKSPKCGGPKMLYRPTLYLFGSDPSGPAYRRIYNWNGSMDLKPFKCCFISFFGSAGWSHIWGCCKSTLFVDLGARMGGWDGIGILAIGEAEGHIYICNKTCRHPIVDMRSTMCHRLGAFRIST